MQLNVSTSSMIQCILSIVFTPVLLPLQLRYRTFSSLPKFPFYPFADRPSPPYSAVGNHCSIFIAVFHISGSMWYSLSCVYSLT